MAIRNTEEYRWSVDAPTQFEWDAGVVQMATVDSGDGRERDVLIDRHSLLMPLDVRDSRTLARMDGGPAIERRLAVGEVTYLPPGHRLNSVSWGVCRFVAVFLDPAAVSATLGRDVAADAGWFRPSLLGAADRSLRHLLLALATEASQPDGADPLRVASLGVETAEHLASTYAVRAPLASLPPPRSRRPVARLMDYVEDRIDSRLTLPELAATCGLSTSQTCRIVRAALGVPLHRYVLSRRLARAVHLLATTPRPISEIAAQTGFSSQSHMTSLFKAHVGRTPAAFRRHARSR
jgi:AraC family transcriptional regulator